MEHASEDAPLSPETRTESQQALVQPSATTRSSNSRALKIAGITTLVCLLLAAQAFTAYMVFNQKQQIQDLQVNNYKLEKQMVAHRRVAPQKMVMPMASLPLMDLFDDEMTSKNQPRTEPPKVTSPSVEEQLKELIRDHELPQMNQTFLTNLETLKQQLTASDFKSFESWLHYWMIFQKAQKTPTPEPAGEISLREAAGKSGRREAGNPPRARRDEATWRKRGRREAPTKKDNLENAEDGEEFGDYLE